MNDSVQETLRGGCIARRAQHEGKLTYSCSCWTLTKRQTDKLNSCYTQFLRQIVKGGTQQETAQRAYTTRAGESREFSKYIHTNDRILELSGSESITCFIARQQRNWIGHCLRASDSNYVKRLTFLDYIKNMPKKSGILDSTYRQVMLRAKSNGITEVNERAKLVARK